MTPIEIIAAAHVAATLIVGGIHAWLILIGLRAMRRASDSRDRITAASERATDQRHAEAMQRLDDQGRAAERRHTEAMCALDALIRQSDASVTALRTLVERTAPASQ